MLAKFSTIVASAFVLLASSAAAAPLSTDTSPILATRQLVSLTVPVTASIGSATCPAPSSGNTVNANVLAVVSVRQELRLAALVGVLGVGVDVNINVCLCVDASLQLTTAQVLDVQAAARTQVIAAPAVTANVAAGDLLNLSLRPTLTPSRCGTCSTTQYPTCNNGACGCANCPPGQTYSASAGACILSPSGTASNNGPGRRALAAGMAPDQVRSRQAKREDIMKRIASKPSLVTV